MNPDWYFNTDEWYTESKQLRNRLNEIDDYTTRRDLYKLYHNLEATVGLIIREQHKSILVNRQSDVHKQLIINFNELRWNFIEYMTVGLLLI